ncbi:MAG: hypothetical protein RL701_6746 [Pseudomonadota bacterium]|jgi:aminoglycoside 2'-N-acetyltransferase I
MPAAPKLTIEHTATLSQDVLANVRHLLDSVFAGDFTDDDWDHALGGLHVLAWQDHELIGHASVVQRQLMVEGRALRTGYVEALGVQERWQRRGVGARIMQELQRVIRQTYRLGALSSADEARELYEHCGWLRWRGATFALTPEGLTRTADEDGGIYVLRCDCTSSLAVTADLVCDFRAGDLW